MGIRMEHFWPKILLALKAPFSAAAREKRMQMFIDTMGIKGGERILDLGGTPEFWLDCPHSLDITIINLPGFNDPDPQPTHHNLTLLEGDARNVEMFDDRAFDIAFSNSVIEHVGDENRQAEMARENARLGMGYWVQTPSIRFPVEAHNHMPFWWFWPKWLRDRTLRRWHRRFPEWAEMIEETRVIHRKDFEKMFPDGEIIVERKYGFTKSYIACRPPA